MLALFQCSTSYTFRVLYILRAWVDRSHHAAEETAKEGDMYQAMIRHNVQVFDMIKTWMKGVANESKVEPISTMVKVANTVLKSYFQNPPTARLHVTEGKAYIGFDAIWEYTISNKDP